jgi:hypothetical protein
VYEVLGSMNDRLLDTLEEAQTIYNDPYWEVILDTGCGSTNKNLDKDLRKVFVSLPYLKFL